MKNSIQILLKTISILVLALLLACNNNSNSKSTNNSPNVGDLALIKKDTCCDLKYPASQIGVKGDDLFNLNFTIVPTGTAGAPYKVSFTPPANFEIKSQAYIDYVKALYPCATGLGSMIIISQGGLGGHTQRRMVEPRYIGFSPGTTTFRYYTLNANDVWDSYYQNPTPLPSTINYGISYGLQPNVIYGIEYGVWIDGCNLTKKEQDCLGYFNYQKFRWQSPQFLKKGESYIILEILDKNDKIIDSRKVSIELEK